MSNKKELGERGEKIKKTLEEYKKIIENTPEGYFESDLQGIFTYCNPAGAQMLGYTPQEVIGTSYREYMTEETIANTNDIFSEVLRSKIPRKSIKYKFIGKQGNEIYCEASIYLRYDSSGKVLGFSGFFRDIGSEFEVKQKLKRSEEKYKRIIESINEGYFEIDKKGMVTFCNQAFSDIFGYIPQEMIGVRYKDVMDKEEAGMAFKIYNRIFRTEEPVVNLQHEFKDKHNNTIYCESSVSLIYDEDGNKRGFRGLMRDVTERVKSKEELKKSREKYRSIIEYSHDGYFQVDLRGTFTFVNKALCELVGYSREEILGANYRRYMEQEGVKKTFNIYNEIFRTEQPYPNFRYVLIHKQGKKIYCESSIYLRWNDERKKIGFAGFVRDLTTQKEAERRFRNIINDSPEGYFEVDLKGHFTYFNPALCKMLGYSANEMMGMHYKEYMNKEKANETFRIFNSVYKTGQTHKSFQYELISKQGRTLYGESSVSLRYGTKDNKVGFSGFVRDVTEKVEAERKLKESEQKYKEAFNRAEFYRDILVHDLSNILSSIKFSFELIEISTKNAQMERVEIEELTEIVQRQLDRASSLISNIRRLSELDKEQLVLKPVKINHILEKTIENVRNHYISGNVNIEFKPLEKEQKVMGGEFLIDAFENIVLNGIIHNESEKKSLCITVGKVQKNKANYIEISFKDNGIGIADEDKYRIFERDYKSKKTRGMGIGLSLVKKIVNEYGGEIHIKNRLQTDYTKGSNFIVHLKKMCSVGGTNYEKSKKKS